MRSERMRNVSEKLLQQILEELKGVKTELKDIKCEQQLTNERLTNIEVKQQVIFEQTGNLTEYHNETISRIDRLQTDIEFTYQKTALHDLKINRMENNSHLNQQ